MSAIDWSEYDEFWSRIGREFAEMLPALIAGEIPTPPSASPSPPWLRRSPRAPPARWIAERRIALGLSQRALAERLGLARVTISGFETGRRRISQIQRERIGAILLPQTPEETAGDEVATTER